MELRSDGLQRHRDRRRTSWSENGDLSPSAVAGGTEFDEQSPWTEEEDAVLREGVLRFGTQAWENVALHLLPPVSGGPQVRSADDCSARWDAVVKNTPVKGPWLPEEDSLLRQLVGKFGPKRWALIASHIPGRAGKQCRERWLNHLDTRVIKSDWTPEEDVILLEAQQRVGNKWSEIARLLPGRAENAVKNRFNSLITKRLTTGIEAARAAGTVDGNYEVVQQPIPADEPDENIDEEEIESKSPQEMLSIMFRRIGESDHVASRVPLLDIRGLANASAPPLVLPGEDGALCEDTPAAAGGEPFALRLYGAAKNHNVSNNHHQNNRQANKTFCLKALDNELQCISLAHRFWGQERARNNLFQKIAFTTEEWDNLEAKAARRANENPNDVAAAASKATAALGDSFLPPPKLHVSSPQLRVRGNSQRRVFPDDPEIRTRKKRNDADPMKLSGTLCSLSIDDASWLGEFVDASFDQQRGGAVGGPNSRDAQTSWSGSPADSSVQGNQGKAAFRDRPSMLKVSESIDDWGGQLVGATFAQSFMGHSSSFGALLTDVQGSPTVSPNNVLADGRSQWNNATHQPARPQKHSPRSDPAVRATLQDMNLRARQAADSVTMNDASMSLDNVDWDLILKMSNNTPRASDNPATAANTAAVSDLDKDAQPILGDNPQMLNHKAIAGYDPNNFSSLEESELTPRARQLLTIMMREQRK